MGRVDEGSIYNPDMAKNYKRACRNWFTVWMLLFALLFSDQAATALGVVAPSSLNGFIVDHSSVDSTDTIIPQAYLTAGSNLNIVFNHQSIGRNIMVGLDQLKTINYDRYYIDLRGTDATVAWFATHHGIGSYTIGTNGDPDSKINGFDNLMRNGYGDVVQFAMTKLGVFDMTYDPALIWDKYRNTYLSLQAAYPKVTFIWFTLPVKTTNDANVNKYNTLVRKYIAANVASNVILYDIADIEADGIRSVDAQGNITSEVMNSNYSHDGIHLNDTGMRRAARALWWLMARLAGWSPSGTPTPPNTPVPTGTPRATGTATPSSTPTQTATATLAGTPIEPPRPRVWLPVILK